MRTPAIALFALPCTLLLCSCRRDSAPVGHDTPPPAACASQPSACASLVQDSPAAWARKPLGFAQVQVPSAWRQTSTQGGVEFRDPTARRRVFFSEVVFPASSAISPQQSLDRLLQRIRPRLSASDLGVRLGPVVQSGSPDQPAVSFLSTAQSHTIFSALLARKTDDSGVRLVSFTYEEDVPDLSPPCIENHANLVLSRIAVSPSPVGSGEGSAVASLVRFSPAASAELARQMNPGDIVWISASGQGRDIQYHLQLRTPDDIPADAVRDRVGGIPVAVDRSSVSRVDGAEIDYSPEGGGFVFDTASAP